MKVRIISVIMAVALCATVSVGFAGQGNEMPSGPHYNLNIIGANDKDDVGDSMGHTLFVSMDGKTRIIMTQAEDGQFVVTDRNGTDGRASFKSAVQDWLGRLRRLSR